jgi:Zn-dependent protease
MIQQNIMKVLSGIAILFPAFLLVFTFHGFFKALFATWMGDDTPKRSGFLSLNPLVHIDIVGIIITLSFIFFLGVFLPGTSSRSFLIVFLIILGVRWTNPVPINEGNFKNEKLGVVLTALAGPIGSFVLALLGMYVIAHFPFSLVPQNVTLTVVEIFSSIIQLALFFGVLDLIPIPPFAGGRLLKYALPVSAQGFVSKMEEYSFIILLVLLLVPGVSEAFFGSVSMLVALAGKGLSFLVI